MTDIEDLADVLDGLARARTAAADPDAAHLLLSPRRVYPMTLPAAQLTINPFEFFILLSLLLSGIAFVFAGVAVPVSVSALLPAVWGFVWSLNVTVGSGLALFGGLARRHIDRGLLFYQLGWGLAGIGALIYGFAVLSRLSVTGLYPGLFNLALATACVVRVFQVQRFFRIADLLTAGKLKISSPLLPTEVVLVPIPHLPPIPQVPGGETDVDGSG